MQRLKNRTILFISIVALIVPGYLRGAEETPATIEELIENARSTPSFEPIWDIGWALSAQGEAAQELLLQESMGKNPSSALASGYALLRLGKQHEGTVALEKIINSEDYPLNRRLEAVASLGVEGGEYASSRLRVLSSNPNLSERLQVEVAKSLWRLTRAASAKARLYQLLNANSTSARFEAALALSDFVPTGEAVDLLGKLAFFPDRLGRRARNALVNKAEVALIDGDFYKIAPLLRRIAEYPYLDSGAASMILDINSWPEVDRDATEDRFAARLINEVSQLIRANYPPDLSGTEVERERELERLQSKNLAIDAVKTFVSLVDPFCAYLDESDLTDMESMLEGKYGGIGAWVGMRFFNGKPRFTILVPMYNQPASVAGLKAMDWIEKIDDVEIAELNLKEIIQKLKGLPGTKVNLLVHRRGWKEAREYIVDRKKIRVPSVRARMLPEKIGYIRIEHFGDEESTPTELTEELKALEEQGMRGLVLDLSNNPGGLLLTAVKVADMFLPKNKLIVYSQGKPDSGLIIHERRDYMSRHNPHPNYPMVVLINRGSASASEIVAGALRDHERATLIGERSFGKGSVQSLFSLESAGPKSKLKLTIAKYYLPNGDCIHNKGIEPDIKIESEIIEAKNWKALNQVRDGLYVFDYVHREFPLHEAKFRELLKFDNEDLNLYPESDALLKEIEAAEITVYPQDLRRELRKELISLLESEFGEVVVIDPESSLALQRALIELRSKLPAAEEESPLYVWSLKKIAEYDEKHKENKTEGDEDGDDDADVEKEPQEIINGTE